MKRLLFFLLPVLLFSAQGDVPVEPFGEGPWLTGPLLAPSGEVIQGGHFNIEPYIYAIATNGLYNNNWHGKSIPTLWSISPEVIVQIGINDWMDFQFTPSFFWNYRQGAAHWELGTLSAQFDFQLHHDSYPHKTWIPSIRFTIQETAPLGKYRNLNPKALRTDIGSNGSWTTSFQLNVSRLIHIRGIHFLNTRLATTFSYAAPVHVKGFNAYGGGYGTNGTVYPPLNLNMDLGLEYTLTQNWALALDVVGSWSSSSRFSGNPGTLPGNLPAPIIQSAAIQYSTAPAIEYNWSENIGIIFGPWLTFAGKNSTKFYSIVAAFNYYN